MLSAINLDLLIVSKINLVANFQNELLRIESTESNGVTLLLYC